MDEQIQSELQDLPTPDTEQQVEEQPQEVEAPAVEQEQQPEDNIDYWKQRAQKAEAKIIKEKKEPKATQPTNQPNPSISEERLERLELRQEGYSPEEVDEIMSLGGRKALNNNLIKVGIEAKRKERKSLEATPTSGGQAPVFKKYTQAQLDAMSFDELDKLVRKS